MPTFSSRAAGAADRPVRERLWLMFRHDMSEFTGSLPDADGTFRDERLGLRAAREVVSRHPGPWRVAFQDANRPAVAFWRRVAAEVAGYAWTEERLPVPDRPDLPPDAWISWPA